MFVCKSEKEREGGGWGARGGEGKRKYFKFTVGMENLCEMCLCNLDVT